jgi:hypothetical protein
MNMQADTFFKEKTKTFRSSKGPAELPIFYYDYSYAHFLFFAEYQRAAAALADTAFAPCRFFNGKAGVLLNFFEYRKTAIGPYNEVGLSILCHPRKEKQPAMLMMELFKDARRWRMGAYVINLPVTTEIAHVLGHEVWSYPKFVTGITADLRGRRFRGIVEDPSLGEPIFTLDGKIGPLGSMISLTNASFISHTTHKGVPLRTLTEVDARYRMNMGFSTPLRVNEKSRHSMAKNLLALGLQGKKPFGCMYSGMARMKLYDGVPIG